MPESSLCWRINGRFNHRYIQVFDFARSCERYVGQIESDVITPGGRFAMSALEAEGVAALDDAAGGG